MTISRGSTNTTLSPFGGGVSLPAVTGNTPTFVGVGTTNDSLTLMQPAWPSGIQPYDIGFLFMEMNDTAPADQGGWVKFIDIQATGSMPTRQVVYWKRTYGFAESAWSFGDVGDHNYGLIIAVRGGPNFGNPYEVVATSSNAADQTGIVCPTVTTLGSNRLIFASMTEGEDTATAPVTGGAWTNANLTSITSRFNAASITGDGGGLGIVTGIRAAAAAIGTTTATCFYTRNQAYATFAIPPTSAPSASGTGFSTGFSSGFA